MTLRNFVLTSLMLAGFSANAQNSLFSTSTSSPTVKTNGAPQPIEVLADGGGTFSLKDEFAFYRGNVRVNDPQFFLRCETLRLNLDMKAAKGTNQPVSSASAPANPPLTAPMGGRVREAEALGNVAFSNKVDGSQAFADRVVYRATNDAFELTGNARMVSRNFTNSAPVIYYYRAEGRFEAVGITATSGAYTPAKTNKSSTLPATAPKQP